jgi:hypothetical protein
MESVLSCPGLQQALREPITAEETSDDTDGEIEANSKESWNLSQSQMNSVLEGASTGVADTTDKEYKR